MLTPDQPQSIRPDLSGPYAKLARHITAMYEIVRLAPTNDPSQPGSPSIGLSHRDRAGVTEHLRECLEMICTLEKWMMNSVAVANPDAPGKWFRMAAGDSVVKRSDSKPDRPEDHLDLGFVGRQREMLDRLHTNDDAAESRATDR